MSDVWDLDIGNPNKPLDPNRHLDILTPHYRQIKEREIRIERAKQYVQNIISNYRIVNQIIADPIDFQI